MDLAKSVMRLLSSPLARTPYRDLERDLRRAGRSHEADALLHLIEARYGNEAPVAPQPGDAGGG